MFEAPWCQLGVSDCRLDVSVAEIGLRRPGIGPLVGQREARGVPEHVWMHLERDLGLDTSPPATENGAPRSDTNMKGDLLSRFSARNARSSSPRSG